MKETRVLRLGRLGCTGILFTASGEGVPQHPTHQGSGVPTCRGFEVEFFPKVRADNKPKSEGNPASGVTHSDPPPGSKLWTAGSLALTPMETCQGVKLALSRQGRAHLFNPHLPTHARHLTDELFTLADTYQ